jgi:Flp pilus assembly protein TadB
LLNPTGALILALAAIFVLGAFAAWLLNVPLWAIAVFLVVGPLLSRWIFRRISRSRARQNTEVGHQG